MKNGEKLCNGIYRIGNFVVSGAGSIIFLILSWYSARYTQYIEPFQLEIPTNRQDSMLQNLLVLLLVLLLSVWSAGFENKISTKTKKIVVRVLVIMMLVWIMAAGFWWICAAARYPGSDQFYVCWDASNFMVGNYTSLTPGSYCEKYPQQLGMTFLLELFFSVVGRNNYFAFEVVSALMAPCIAFLGYCIVKEITDSFMVSVSYCICMSSCLPLIFYTSWVYGEIPSLFFSFLAVLGLLRYINRGKTGYLVGVVFSLTLAKMCRENASILIIAVGLTALLNVIKKRDGRLLIATICALLVPYLTFWGIQEQYEIRSGYEKSEGLPTSAWISIGLMEQGGRYGWNYGYEGEVYEDVGYDQEKADEIYKSEIGKRITTFMQSPGYAITFFREKILSQWNAPLYQSYYFSLNYEEGKEPAEDSFVMKLSTDYFGSILLFCDRLQFILYVGMLFYTVSAVNEKSNMVQHVLLVTIIGGFLFTAMWEAKARYVFPYYISMFPMAVLGYRQFALKLQEKFTGIRN